jgi:hypothetical protein
MAGEHSIAKFVEGYHFVNTTDKNISVSSVRDRPSVCTGKLSTDANLVAAQDYASMGEKRPVARHVEVKLCVSMGKSRGFVLYV